MKKLLSILLIFAGFSSTVFAQTKLEHAFELGAGYNFAKVFYWYGGPEKCSGPGAYFEYREVLKNFDVGAQLNYMYLTGEEYSDNLGSPYVLGVKSHQVFLKVFGDYNFLPEFIVNPYLGVEAGGGLLITDFLDNDGFNRFCSIFGLRVGAHIWHFNVRAAFEFPCSRIWNTRRNSYKCFASNIALTLGYTF